MDHRGAVVFWGLAALLLIAPSARASIYLPQARLPLSDKDKNSLFTAKSLIVGDVLPLVADKTNAPGSIGGFNVIARTGQIMPNGIVAGLASDQNGVPLAFNYNTSAAGLGSRAAGKPTVSNSPDFISFVKGAGADEVLVTVQFESPSPSSTQIFTMTQAADGKLAYKSGPVYGDYKKVGGLLNACSGSLSPWSTHFSGEEADPDARVWDAATTLAGLQSADSNLLGLGRYFGIEVNSTVNTTQAFTLIKSAVQPYRYGFFVEVNPYNPTQTNRWYTLGRAAWESLVFTPVNRFGNRTIYLSEDTGTGGGFFKFVGRGNDLSLGTLYAAKFKQNGQGAGGGRFSLTWIQMAAASQSELENLVNKPGGLRFAEIFNATAVLNTTVSGVRSCPAGFVYVRNIKVNSVAQYGECLSLMPGMEKAAAFFETRRYAGYLGATIELTKMEGVTLDTSTTPPRMWAALTRITRYMLPEPFVPAAGTTRNGTEDDIQIQGYGNYTASGSPGNPCGCMYAMEMDGDWNGYNFNDVFCGCSAQDSSASCAASSFNQSAVPGYTTAANATVRHLCDPENIASPDNVVHIPGTDSIIIYEDAGSDHVNNFLWQYNTKSGELVRIGSAPYGAEFSGNGWYTINGFSYLSLTIQHANPSLASTNNFPNNGGFPGGGQGYFGYLGPFRMNNGRRGSRGRGPFNQIGFEAVGLSLANSQAEVARLPVAAYIGQPAYFSYMETGKSGKAYGGTVLAAITQRDGVTPIYEFTSSTSYVANRTRPIIANSPDFAALLPRVTTPSRGSNRAPAAASNKFWSVINYEAPNPGDTQMVAITQLRDGVLVPESVVKNNWTQFDGLWIPCAATVTPWQTRLGGEEYESDVRRFETATSVLEYQATFPHGAALQMARYDGLYIGDLFANQSAAMDRFRAVHNPYKYGYIFEVDTRYGPEARLSKHYTMGRIAHELGYVMPDKKTVYLTDDGTNIGFYMWKGTGKPGDLTRGTLYAAQVKQLSVTPNNGGTFDITWIELGTSTNAQVLAMINSKPKFSDIWEASTLDLTVATPACPAGFRSVNLNQSGQRAECLKIKPGRELMAAFLETRRYAAYLGATTEFSKWEGITFSPENGKLYTAMSEVSAGMEDNKFRGLNNTQYDVGGRNDVKLPANTCGCVYELDMTKQFTATQMRATLCGVPSTAVGNNTCSVEGISNPDNIAYVPGHNTLLIYEDGSPHQNNMLWKYDLTVGTLTRVATVPFGAEATGAWVYTNLNGFGYIALNVQHPYEEGNPAFFSQVNSPYSFGMATTGYLGPLGSKLMGW